MSATVVDPVAPHRRRPRSRNRLDVADALESARVRSGDWDFIGYLSLYCPNRRCSVREIDVRVKEYDAKTATDVRCPCCHARIELHGVETLHERDEEDQREARSSVNIQIWRRRHPGVLGVPAGVLLDDRLPGESS